MLTLVLCVLAANLVFIRQAFHIDDGIYLLLARNIATSPWFPQDFPTYFEGLYVPDLASTEHPLPVTSYWMALIGRFSYGLTEVSLHLGFLIFPLILVYSMYVLARRYTACPLLASLTLLFLPVVYVLSHTVMTDVPQLALWVASVAMFIQGMETRNAIWVSLGGVAATFACFVSYSSLSLIPLLAVLARLRKDRGALNAILIFPGMILGIWLAVSFSHYGRLPPAQLLGFYFLVKQAVSPVLLIRKCIYIILAIGSVTIFPLGLLVSSRKRSVAVCAGREDHVRLFLLRGSRWDRRNRQRVHFRTRRRSVSQSLVRRNDSFRCNPVHDGIGAVSARGNAPFRLAFLSQGGT